MILHYHITIICDFVLLTVCVSVSRTTSQNNGNTLKQLDGRISISYIWALLKVASPIKPSLLAIRL